MHQRRPACAGEGTAMSGGTPREGCALTARIEEALAGPVTGEALDAIGRVIWQAYGAGTLGEAETERLDARVRLRRAAIETCAKRGGGAHRGRPAPVRAPRVRRPRSPDRAASIARRRRMAASGAVPPELAEHFTPGQVAVLSVVGREAMRTERGCRWPMDRIAALAGVCRTVAVEAIRLAHALGLLRRSERRRRGARSETNVVTIRAGAWRRWLRRGPKEAAGEGRPKGGGCGKAKPTYTEDLREDVGADRKTDGEGKRLSAEAQRDALMVTVAVLRRKRRDRPPSRAIQRFQSG